MRTKPTFVTFVRACSAAALLLLAAFAGPVRAQGAPFGCTADFYQTRQGTGGTALLRFPPAVLTGGGTATNVYGALQAIGVNGLGLRATDGYLYGLRTDAGAARLVRLGTTGIVDVGTIVTTGAQTPVLPASFTPTAGVFDSAGRFYFAGQGGGNISPSAIYRVDDFVTDVSGTAGVQLGVAQVYALSATTVNIGDLAFAPDGNLYGASGTTLVQLVLSGGTATVNSRTVPNVGSIGSAFYDTSGSFFVYDNTSAQLVEVNFSLGPAFPTAPVSVGSPITITPQAPVPASTSSSDGASCTNFTLADLSLTKIASNMAPVVGSNLTFTITVNNAGPNPASGVTVSDPLPSGYTYVSDNGAGTYNSGTGTWTIPGSLAAGGSASLQITATVNATGSYANTAQVASSSAADADSTPNNNAAGEDDQSTVTPVPSPRADLSLTKSVNNPTPNVGANVVFTITVSNAGPSAATGVVISDQLPAGYTYVSDTGAGAYNSGTGLWTVPGSLASGANAVLQITATVNASGPYANTAQVSTSAVTDPDSTPGNGNAAEDDQATSTPTPVPTANLAIDKSGTATVTQGGTVTYTIRAWNNGPSAVTGATITDTVPANLTSVTWTCVGTGTGTCGAPSGTGNAISVSANLPVDTGSATTADTNFVTITVTGTATTAGTLTNTANIATPVGTTDPTPGNNSDGQGTAITPAADLAIDKSGTSTVAQGGTVTYTILAWNNGPSAVTGATITDTVPANLTSVTWTCVGTGTGTCGAPSGTGNAISVSANLPVDTGSTTTADTNFVTITVTGTATTLGTFTNTASVAPPAGTTDPTGGNNSDGQGTTINSSADLAIDKSGTATVTQGGTVTYTIRAWNNGQSAVTGATITDTVPANLTSVTWTCVGTGTGTCGAPSGTGSAISVSANLPVDTGSATTADTNFVTITVTGTATTPGVFTNTASIAPPAGTTDPTGGNNSDGQGTTIGASADLAIDKSGTATVTQGGTVTYTIRAWNNGPSAVTGATITDTVPANLTSVTWTCVGTGTGTCGAPSGIGSAISVSANLPVDTGSATTADTNFVTITVTGTATTAGLITNTASIAPPAGTTDPTGGNNSDGQGTTIGASADLAIDKSGTATVTQGGTVTYTIRAWNNGPSAVTGATIADTVPANLTSVTWTCTGTGTGTCGAPSGSGNAISVSANLPVDTGSTTTADTNFVTITVTGTATTAGSITNIASVVAPIGTTDPTPANDSDGQSTLIDGLPTAVDDGTLATPAYTVAEDGGATILTPLVTDNDDFGGDGPSMGTITIIATTGGSATVNNGGTPTDPTDDTVVFTPTPNFSGVATVTYEICDADGDCDTAVAYITVTPVNDTPTAVDEGTPAAPAYSVAEDSGATILNPLVTDNDDFGGDGPSTGTITIIATTGGSATVNNGGTPTDPTDDTVVFTPAANFNGVATVTYEICDADGDCDQAVAYITVTPVDDVPTAVDDGTPAAPAYTVAEDSGATLLNPLVTDNDDFGGDGPSTGAITIIGSTGGTATVNNGGTPNDPTDDTVVFTPAPNFNGVATVTYEICDADGDCDAAVAYITVTPLNDTPTAVDEGTLAAPAYTVAEDSGATILNPLVTDNDDFGGDGPSTGAISIIATTGGTATVNNGGTPNDPTDDTVVFTPAANFNGVATVTYEICDADGDCDQAVAYITVTPVDDTPTAVDEGTPAAPAYTVAEDSGATLLNPLVTDNDDFGGDGPSTGAITIIATTGGSATVNNGGTPNDPTDDTVVFTPAPNFSGVATVTYEICDADGDCDQAVAYITVTPVDDTPTAVDDGTPAAPAYTIAEDSGATILNPLVTDNDDFGGDGPSTGAITIIATTGGSATVNNGGTPNDPTDDTVVFTPAPNFNGVATVTYEICDADGDCDQAVAYITVTPVNDAIAVTKIATLTTDNGTIGQADAGDVITYAVSVVNTGDSTITGLVVADSFEGGIATALTCTPTTLPPAATATCTAYTHVVTQADVDAGGTLDNQVTASGTDPGGSPVTDIDTTSTPVATSDAELTVTKTAALTTDNGTIGQADAGDVITYTVSVQNTGNVTVDSLVVTDSFEGGAATTLTCTPTTLAPGASANCTTYTHVVTQAEVDAGGALDNVATATADDPANAPVTDTDGATVPVAAGAPVLAVSKTAAITTDNGTVGLADAGDVITYSVSVQNTGNVTVTGLTVADSFEGGVSTPLTCTPATLAPGASATCTAYTHTVTQAEVDAGGTLDNVATATGQDPGGNPVTDTGTSGTPVAGGAPQLTVAKSATLSTDNGTVGLADVGDVITYTVSVQNTGNVTITGLTVADSFEGGIATALTCTPATLPPAAIATCTSYTHTVTQADVDAGGALDNVATASGSDPGGNPVTDTDGTSTPVAANAPQLTVTKTAALTTDDGTVGLADAGDVITYSVSVQNIGNVTIDSLVVTDSFEGGAAVTLTCTPTTLVPGASATCTTYTHTVTQAEVDAGGTLDNLVSASGEDPSNSPVTDTDTTSTPVASSTPQLTVTKTATLTTDNGTVGLADAGDVITYSVSVQNTGNVTVDTLVVTDSFEGGAAVALTCTPTTLIPGASANCTSYAHTVTQAEVDAGGTLDNVATASAQDPGGNPVSDTGTATVPVAAAGPQLTVTKFAALTTDGGTAGLADAGDVITYSVSVQNTGNVTIDTLVVTDSFEGGAAVTLTCAPATLPVGASATCNSYTHTVTQAEVDAGTALDNVATATGEDPGGNPVTDDATTTTPVAGNAPQLTVTKTATITTDNGTVGLADAGDVITYAVSVQNTGNVTVTGLTVTDSFEGGAAVTLTCTPATLAPGASASCTAYTHTVTQAEVDGGGTLDNVATATGQDPGGNPVTDTGTSGTPVAGGAPQLTVIKTATLTTDAGTPGVADAGDVITYAVSVQNTGNVTIAALVVTDSFEGGVATTLTCAPTTLTVGASATCNAYTHLVTQGEVDAGGTLDNVATATGTDPGGNPVTDTGTASTPVSGASADLSITKTVDNAAPAIGSNVTFTLTVVNTGPSSATGVVVNDLLPAGYTFVSAAPSQGSYTAGTGVWTIGTLANGANATLTMVATVNATGPYANVATVDATTPDPDPSDDTDTEITVPTAIIADLGVVKTGPAQVLRGQQVVFTIVVRNAGPGTAVNARLDDPTPAGLVFVSTGGACSGPFPCSLGNLANGDTRTLTATYSVPANYSGPAMIVNTATVTSDSADPTPSDSSSSSSVVVQGTVPPPPPMNIPVDARWAMLLMVALMMMIGSWSLRREP